MNTLYKITFGTEFDKNANKLVNEVDQLPTILKNIANFFGGFSIDKHSGGYVHNSGTLVIEQSQTIEILGNVDQIEDVEKFAASIKKALRQESVIVTSQPISVNFI